MKEFKKIRYSDFVSIEEVMSSIEFKYDSNEREKKEKFFDDWENIVGEKLAKVSKPIDITDKNVLLISCMNSFVANEMFLLKKDILTIMEEDLKKLNLKIEDIYFDYKSWKKR